MEGKARNTPNPQGLRPPLTHGSQWVHLGSFVNYAGCQAGLTPNLQSEQFMRRGWGWQLIFHRAHSYKRIVKYQEPKL